MAITVDTTEENLKTTMDNLLKKKKRRHKQPTHSSHSFILHRGIPHDQVNKNII